MSGQPPPEITNKMWERVVMILVDKLGVKEVVLTQADMQSLADKLGNRPALITVMEVIDGKQTVSLTLCNEADSKPIIERMEKQDAEKSWPKRGVADPT